MIRKKILSISFVLLLVSCTEDFQSINTNPNAPTEVHPSLLLRQILFNYAEEMSYEGFVAGNLLGQYFTQIDFNLFDRHSLSDTQFGGNPWPFIYRNLRDNEIILNISRDDLFLKVYEAPSLILKAYMTAALTDIYGDVPYSEALQGTQGLIKPAYDLQEDIYYGPNGILSNLELAIDLIEDSSSGQVLDGDILFNGDLESWKKFANSLRIKYMMRISDVKNMSSQLQEIYNTGTFISSNSENAIFDFTDSQPNNFRMANLRDGDFNLFILSETMEEILKSLDDTRISKLFRPTGNSAGQEYIGLLNGPDASQTSISVNDYSLSGTIFRESTGELDANYMTAWETYFFLAEAAHKGIIQADAKSLYDQAVSLAFEYWNTELPDKYLEEGNAAFKTEIGLEQIITQKWIANIINGYEGWIEYRRTSYPQLKTISASLNNDLIPVKMPYPADEIALNLENYQSATQGGNNDINLRVWWDVD